MPPPMYQPNHQSIYDIPSLELCWSMMRHGNRIWRRDHIGFTCSTHIHRSIVLYSCNPLYIYILILLVKPSNHQAFLWKDKKNPWLRGTILDQLAWLRDLTYHPQSWRRPEQAQKMVGIAWSTQHILLLYQNVQSRCIKLKWSRWSTVAKLMYKRARHCESFGRCWYCFKREASSREYTNCTWKVGDQHYWRRLRIAWRVSSGTWLKREPLFWTKSPCRAFALLICTLNPGKATKF